MLWTKGKEGDTEKPSRKEEDDLGMRPGLLQQHVLQTARASDRRRWLWVT